MACLLTSGRDRPCFDTVGGLKKIYFADYGTLGAITYDVSDTDVVTTFGDAPEFFEYDLMGSASTFTQTITKDVNNGTSFYAQGLEVTIPKLTKAMNKELKLLVYNMPHVIVQDFNDNYFVMGLENGANVTGGTVVTGGAKGDLSGYTLSLTAEEKLPANFLAVDIPTTTATISATKEQP